MKNQAPIGIFDSGIGGTSIWKELHKLMPLESTIYLADSANAPYGNKSKEAIIALCVKNTEYLIELGCKIIVVACNTATTNAISYLRATYDILFIGIEPAIKPAALQSKTNSIGILATKGTLSSRLFHTTSKSFTDRINITEIVGEGLVPLIEEGVIKGPKIIKLLTAYTTPMLAANIDHLVLGCSHYPYLLTSLQQILPNHIKIIDSGEAVAKQTKKILTKNQLVRQEKTKPILTFFTNKNSNTLKAILKEYHSSITIIKKEF